MSRNTKAIIDYFPHYVNHGKTLPIIERMFGNDGYVLFFKMLEFLGRMEGHFYHFANNVDEDYFFSQVCVEKEKGFLILDKLAELNSIDKELWLQKRVLWSNNFVKRDLAVIYARRNTKVDRPDPDKFETQTTKPPIKAEQSIVEYSRVEETEFSPTKVQLSEDNVDRNRVGLGLCIQKSGQNEDKFRTERTIFDQFRKKYPGTKRGLDTEFKNFQKHKDWKEILPKLEELLDGQIEQRKQLAELKKKDRNILIPFWQHLKTWINQRSWEQETIVEEPERKDDNYRIPE